jgi:uncharacterized membrane protein (DUF485 family)
MSLSEREVMGRVGQAGKKLDLHSEEYLHKLMTSQFALSFKLFLVFLVILLGLPTMNYIAPEVMNVRIFGFTFTWFFLAVLIYPLTWLISWVYVKTSIKLEEEAATWADPEEH